MKRDSQILNWLIWSIAFFVGTAILGWLEWHSGSPGAMGWFISVSIWSMVCGIGFTLVEWLLWKD